MALEGAVFVRPKNVGEFQSQQADFIGQRLGFCWPGDASQSG
jgi:hypothetical protein